MCAWAFADSFDCYAAVGDAALGYWDSFVNTAGPALVAGRFTNSRAWRWAATGSAGSLTKSSGVGDAVHHLSIAYYQNAALTGSAIGAYFQFNDSATAQCTIAFRQDGVVLLTSGTSGGAVLATYTGAVTAANTWTAFEFEIVINNTVGRFRARKNGNTTDDFDSGATLNTRPGTNSYANRLTYGVTATAFPENWVDDLIWRSDASSVPWAGDMRIVARMPASDVQAQFSKSLTSITNTTGAQFGNATISANNARYSPITATSDGTVTAITFGLSSNFTGNIKCSVFADASNAPGAIVASATAPANNPLSGTNTFSFSPGFAVTRGTKYWIGIVMDTTMSVGNIAYVNSGAALNGTAVSYASFPQANPAGLASGNSVFFHSWVLAPGNFALVNEAQQDGATSYVYSATPGQSDLYGIAALSTTPASVLGVTTRGYVQKSDAGTRFGAVQLKSGGTTVQSTSTALSSSWGWLWRVDLVDPATGSAWTAAGVNSAQIGPVCVS